MHELSALIFLFALFAWVGGAVMVSYATGERGRSSGSWFLLAFFFSPLLAVVCLCATPIRQERPQERP